MNNFRLTITYLDGPQTIIEFPARTLITAYEISELLVAENNDATPIKALLELVLPE